MKPESSFTASRRVEAVWEVAWGQAVGRPDLARELRRARFDVELDGELATASRAALLARVQSEVERFEAAVAGRRRYRWRMGLLLFSTIVSTGLVMSRLLGILRVNDSEGSTSLVVLGVALVAALASRAVSSPPGAPRRYERSRARLLTRLDGLLVPYLRRHVNARLRVPFDCLEVRDVVGLSEVVDPSLEIPTRARARLTALMKSMSSGSVGVSGSRGAGKTTLIRAACAGRLTPSGLPPTLGAWISAPVKWEASEFIPFLFSELCVNVAPELREELPARRRSPLFDLVALCAGMLLAAGLAVNGMQLLVDGPAPFRVREVAALGLMLLGTLIAIALAHFTVERLLTRPSRRGRVGLAQLAERHLRELRYRETVVQGWSLGGTAPLGFSLGGTREETATQLPLTLPEVVARYKAFVERVAEHHTLVIGIDELDKMESAEDAARFLSEIKVLFGEQPCFYLVSVSDDAMSEFERRGVPLRTVFDSSFDEVLHVDTLSLQEARAIVNGRVVGMGDAHVALCYVLGDGTPRELIRCVRSAIEASAEGASSPADVARALAVRRMQRIEDAVASIAARDVGVDGRHPLLDWLDRLPPLTPETLGTRWEVRAPYLALDDDATRSSERDAHRLMLLELATMAYRAATIVELWDEVDENLLEATTRRVRPSPVLDLLAKAGRDLVLGPSIAWRTVDEARQEMGRARRAFPVDAVRPAVVPTANGNGGLGLRRLLTGGFSGRS